MHAAGRPMTAGAAGAAPSARHQEREVLRGADDPVQAEVGQVGDEQGKTHEQAPSRPCSYRHRSPAVLPDSVQSGCIESDEDPKAVHSC